MVNLSHSTVAVFATLLVAVQVNCNTGCYFDFDHGNGAKDYNLECNNLKNSWIMTEGQKGNDESKAFALDEDVGGCIKTSAPVVLNSSSTVRVTFKKTNMNENDVLFTVTLVPQGGSCASPEECKWIVKRDDKMMPNEWNTVHKKFPLKDNLPYFIQLDVVKSKGKFELKSINVPDVEDKKCKKIDFFIIDSIIPEKLIQEVDDAVSSTTAAPDGGGGGGGGDSGGEKTTTPSAAPGLMEISKNLLITTASIILLNILYI